MSIHSLRRHQEGHVAQERAAGRYHLDFAGGAPVDTVVVIFGTATVSVVPPAR
jgi:hypothetical protein